jgi:GT2 family glycosyltransferase
MSAATILVNWNGWADTIECLESLLRSDCPMGPIIVCDNDSQDRSIEHLKAWADGRLEAWLPPDSPLRGLVVPPVVKPVAYVEYDRAEAERGGSPTARDVPLVLVRTGGNLGFAGGNNVGLRYVLARGDLERVWLLNNDTVVLPDALRRLSDEMRDDSRLGICGSTLRFYEEPEVVQALGGASYNRWFALPRHIGEGTTIAEPLPDRSQVVERLAFVAGASMLVSRRFLEEVGLLDEQYFLYFEELDWILRARGRFSISWAPKSVVFHKEGASTGSRARLAAKTWTADYHFMRNRLRITWRYFRSAVPTVYLALGVAAARRLSRRDWGHARMIVKLCMAR